ncbi:MULTISPECIES: hypothetical protein [unclassified Nocardiopsis]|uniref:hypothetical protein n=1 Tax=unclassified Nocardiopsis TaxID=2649073 RepID=UPI00135A86CD|nr:MULTISPECIES: hypothetical protein [unclassified Nocardiopsis]
MTEEFRAAFQRVLDTAANQAPDFPGAVHDVFRLSSQVPVDELAIAMEALAPVLSDAEPTAGIAADLAVLAGALVESGAPAGQVGLEVLRQLGSYGQAAVAFMHAWDKTGGGAPPAPPEVSEAEEARVEEVLGENAPLATVGWWTSLRYGLAAKAMLGDARVRAAVRSDPSALEGLTQIVHALSTQLSEFVEVNELLRMAEADTALVLDRASWRGFRVRFDGIGDNFQLHTLLADALIGKEGRRVPGTRPDPRWTAACLDAPADPLADVVRGEWDLVGGDGTWVGNEACPGDIPVLEGERVLVLEPQTLTHSWRAGRRHPHIPGSLEVVEEIPSSEAAAWWSRIHPAGAVRHPLAPPLEHDETGTHRAPRHFGVAAHFAEVDSGPMSATFRALEPEEDGAPRPGAWRSPGEYDDASAAPGSREPRSASAGPDAPAAPQDPWGAPADAGGTDQDLTAVPHAWNAPGYRDELSEDRAPLPHAWDDPPAADGPAQPVWGRPVEHRVAPAPDGPAEPHPWEAFTGHGDEQTEPGEPPRTAPAERSNGAAPAQGPDPDPRADAPASPAADERPSGAHQLPPMPPGVSDSWSWAPRWKWPAPPEPPR